jgi:uncharacterized membrane protein HdeD (DUF308 family)
MNWGWLLSSGVIAFLLGALIILLWPAVAGWVIGLLVGIDLMLSGWWMLMLAFASKHAEGDLQAALEADNTPQRSAH